MYRQNVPSETSDGNGSSVKFASDLNAASEHVPQVSITEGAGYPAVSTATFASPASGVANYTIGDMVGPTGTIVPLQFTVARKVGGAFSIRRARMKKASLTNIALAQFRIKLFKTQPASVAADNAAFACTESNYLGSIDVAMDQTFTDFLKGIGMPNMGMAIEGTCEADKTYIYGLVEARAAYVEVASEAFEIALEHFRF